MLSDVGCPAGHVSTCTLLTIWQFFHSVFHRSVSLRLIKTLGAALAVLPSLVSVPSTHSGSLPNFSPPRMRVLYIGGVPWYPRCNQQCGLSRFDWRDRHSQYDYQCWWSKYEYSQCSHKNGHNRPVSGGSNNDIMTTTTTTIILMIMITMITMITITIPFCQD